MRKWIWAFGSVVVFAFAACDLGKLGNQLTANKVMVGTVFSTPQVNFSPAAVAGIDAGAGVDAGVVSIPSQTAAFVFFGTHKGLDSAPVGISDAQVTVSPSGGTATSLTNDGEGKYSKTSAQDPSFTYQSTAAYNFEAVSGGASFMGTVKDAPPIEQIPEFHPAKGYVSIQTNAAFSFARPDPGGKERNLGFVTVFPLGNDGSKGEPTYTNVPTAPLDFLKLIAIPAEWKKSPVQIPGSAFPTPATTYLLVFQSVKTGGPETDNLFAGSALMAGTADVAILRTP